MKILAIDDQKERHDIIDKLHPDDEIFHVYTVDQAAQFCMEPFDIVYIDHDAGMFQPENGETHWTTFFPCACILALNPNIGEIRVHSMNRVGAERIHALLRSWDKNVVFVNIFGTSGGYGNTWD
jgi:hypothetical protein